MTKLLSALALGVVLSLTAFGQAVGDTTQERLKGSVKSLRVENSKISGKHGKSIKGPRVLSAE